MGRAIELCLDTDTGHIDCDGSFHQYQHRYSRVMQQLREVDMYTVGRIAQRQKPQFKWSSYVSYGNV